MNSASHFTRGGQIAMHNLRMLQQITNVALLLSLCCGLSVMCLKTYKDVPSTNWVILKEYWYAKLQIDLSLDPRTKLIQHFPDPKGGTRVVSSRSLVKNPTIRQKVGEIEQMIFKNVLLGLEVSLGSLLLIVIIFILQSRARFRKKQERGGTFMTPPQLKKLLRRQKQGSDLKIDALPLVKDKETSHLLMTGTTGSGKSNAFHTLMPQIRKRGDKAIIVDITGGSLISQFFHPETDLILNPFDQRSQLWNPWQECQMPSHYDVLAEAIIPAKKSTFDSFWEEAGRALFSVAMQKLKACGETNTHSLYTLLTQASVNEFHHFFADTEAATFADKSGERTTMSIRSNLATHLIAFKYIDPTPQGFSIREWIADEQQQGWLFLTARNDQRTALKPLITAWLDTAFNALLTLTPSHLRRFWFVIDELPGLQKLPTLPMALAESRKYGACIFAGLQNFPQIRDLYGHEAAKSMLDQFNTKLFFRSTDPETTSWISKVLGEAEETEVIENLSYGANAIRDGVSLNQHTKTKPLVLPTEIATLQDLECYLKYPGHLPISKLKMSYKQPTQSFTPFVLKEMKEMKFRLEKIEEDRRADSVHEMKVG